MNHKERMLANLPYKSWLDGLSEERMECKKKIYKYNNLPPDAQEERTVLLREMLGKTKDGYLNIESPFHCDYGYNIEIGENFFANYNFVVLDGNFVRIGDNVWIAPNVGIYAAGHPLDVGDRIAGWEYAFPVTIGNNVWIGGGVQIIGGVTIGDNAVVAAGSVVIRDVPANTLVAGNPARTVRRITAKDRQKYAWAPPASSGVR